MTDFERILDECLDDLERGVSNVDECLARHPGHTAQLEPILLTAARLEAGRAVRPSKAFIARSRAGLTQHMHAHPRKRAQFGFVVMRLATSLAVIVMALLATGTAYAQSALPGDPFYAWKLASENAWRAITPDPVRTDLAIANRRIEEMNAVSGDPIRQAQALEGYQNVLSRLESELDAETLERILPPIEIDVEEKPTEASGQPIVPTPPLVATAILPTEIVSTPIPQTEIVETALPPLPEIPRTKIPKIIPTIEIPPPIP